MMNACIAAKDHICGREPVKLNAQLVLSKTMQVTTAVLAKLAVSNAQGSIVVKNANKIFTSRILYVLNNVVVGTLLMLKLNLV